MMLHAQWEMPAGLFYKMQQNARCPNTKNHPQRGLIFFDSTSLPVPSAAFIKFVTGDSFDTQVASEASSS